MSTLAIVNQKGGVGKTTSAVTLAHGLAQRGRRVLLVDLDAQGNVGDALGVKKSNGLYRLLIENAGQRAICPSGRENLDLVLSDKSTVEAKAILIGKPFRETILKNELARIKGYDWVILDVAPGIDMLQLGALIAATHYLVPVNLAHLALVGASDLLATATAQKEMLKARFLGVLPTFLDRRLKETNEHLTTLAEQFGRLVWQPIPTDAKAIEAPSFGKTLWEYAPDARALTGVDIKGRQVGGYSRVLERLVREVGDG